MNLQAIADARGNLLWISGAIRGSTHDIKAARIWQIPRLLAEHGLFALGDKGYEGLDQDLVATPFKGRGKPSRRRSKTGSTPGYADPASMFAQLKKWSILDQVRCDPDWATRSVKAIQVLNGYELRCSVPPARVSEPTMSIMCFSPRPARSHRLILTYPELRQTPFASMRLPPEDGSLVELPISATRFQPWRRKDSQSTTMRSQSLRVSSA
jgi:hypothetical protein